MTDVFISYSRRDQGFVRRLHAALEQSGRDAWVDWQDIPPTAEWLAEIRAAIAAADAFAFVISPDSVSSRVCSLEVDHAIALNKRLIPLLRVDIPSGSVQPRVGAHNWIPFRDQDDFQASFASLLEALDTDLDRVRAHTRLTLRAAEWDAHGQDGSYLLHGRDLEDAEAWLGAVGADPAPTAMQGAYIVASRRAAIRGQRRRLAATGIALVVMAFLTVFAFVQLVAANEQRQRAEDEARVSRARELAAASVAQLPVDPELGLILAQEAERTRPTDGGLAALRQALVSSRVRMTLSHPDQVQDAAWSPDGSTLATAASDGVARLYDAASGRQLRTLSGHTRAIVDVTFAPDGSIVATSSDDGTVGLWEVATGKRLEELRAPFGGVAAVAFDPAGGRFATVGGDRIGRIWDATSGTLEHELAGHSGQIFDVAFSPDGMSVLTAGADGSARLWDAANGTPLRVTTVESGINGVAFAPDGRTFAIACADGTVRVMDAATGEERARLDDRGGTVHDVAFDPSGRLLLTATLDGVARIWDLERGVVVVSLRGHTGTTWAAGFSPDGRRVITASADGSARVWDVDDREVILRGHVGSVLGVSFGPDGQRILTAGDDQTARIWDAATGLLLTVLRGHQGQVVTGSFSPDGSHVATASLDRSAIIWNALTGEPQRLLADHLNLVWAARFSPDGERIVSASFDGEARVWNARAGTLEQELIGHLDAVADAAFDPSGTRVATASVDRTARIWDAQTGRTLHVLRGHSDSLTRLAYSPDGQTLATASTDGTVRVWDASSGALLTTLRGHSSAVSGVAYSPDGAWIATIARDGSLRLWDPMTGSGTVLAQRPDPLFGVAFSPDGHRIAVAAGVDDAWVVRCEVCVAEDRLLSLASDRITRPLDADERRQYLGEVAISSPAASPQPSPEAGAPSPSPVSSVSVTAAGLSLDVPQGWVALDPATAFSGPQADLVVAENPVVARVVEAGALGMVQLLMVDRSGEAPGRTLVLVTQPDAVPAGRALDDLGPGLAAALVTQLELSRPPLRRLVDLPIGPAWEFRLTYDLRSTQATNVMYLWAVGQDIWSLSFSSMSLDWPRSYPLFRQIVSTLRAEG